MKPGWYGAAVFAAYDSVDSALAKVDPNEAAVWRAALAAGNTPTMEGCLGDLPGCIALHPLPTGGVLGLFTLAEWRGNDPVAAFAEAVAGQRFDGRYPIAVYWLTLNAVANVAHH